MASTPDFEDLLARWFDGDLDPEEEARLDALLAADPAAFERFRGLLGIEGLLRAREGDVDRLPGRVLESLQAEGPRRRLTHRVMETIQGRKSTARFRRREQVLAWAAAAAALLVAAFAAAVLRPSRPVPPKPVQEEARVEPLVPPPVPPAPVPTKESDTFVRPPAPAPPPPPPVPMPVPTEVPDSFVQPPRLPVVPPEPPKADPAPTTVERRALAVLRSPAGVVKVSEGEARDGAPLYAGAAVETAAGTAAVEFPDGTRLELGEQTELRELADREGGRKPRGLRWTVARGAVSATVAKQAVEQPFTLLAAQAEARVLGTQFRFSVEAGPKGRCALEVTEGRVRLVRLRDGKTADLGPGLMAVAGPEGDLAPRSAAVDEIGLTARDARFAGAEWKLVADPRASTGAALEAQRTPHKVTDHVETRAAYVAFQFWAKADKEYTLWVRAHSQGTGDPWTRDFLTVQPLDARLSHPSPFFGTAPTTAFVFTGLGAVSTYAWLSGEEGRGGPATLRGEFQPPGVQTLRLYSDNPGIRVDAVWLSASQPQRPAPRAFPPRVGGD
jgi:hypothetical protein